MSSPLQKSPIGVLGALALQNLGRNPDRFGGELQPSVDLYDHYLLRELELLPSSVTITNPATSNTQRFDVPQGQVWRILGIGGDGVLASADAALTVYWATAVYSNGAVDSMQVQPNALMGASGSNGRAKSIGILYDRPLLLPAGWSFGASVALSAAPAINFSFSVDLLIQRILEA